MYDYVRLEIQVTDTFKNDNDFLHVRNLSKSMVRKQIVNAIADTYCGKWVWRYSLP